MVRASPRSCSTSAEAVFSVRIQLHNAIKRLAVSVGRYLRGGAVPSSDDPTGLCTTEHYRAGGRETRDRTRTLDRGPLAQGPREGPFDRPGVARGTGPQPHHGPAVAAVELSPDGPLCSFPASADGRAWHVGAHPALPLPRVGRAPPASGAGREVGLDPAPGPASGCVDRVGGTFDGRAGGTAGG